MHCLYQITHHFDMLKALSKMKYVPHFLHRPRSWELYLKPMKVLGYFISPRSTFLCALLLDSNFHWLKKKKVALSFSPNSSLWNSRTIQWVKTLPSIDKSTLDTGFAHSLRWLFPHSFCLDTSRYTKATWGKQDLKGSQIPLGYSFSAIFSLCFE